MKKIFRFAAVLFLGALVAVACEDKPTPDDPKDNPDDPKDNPEVTVSPYKIALDASFSDWDAITKKDDFADVYKGASDDPIQTFKITSDADNIYFYIEFLADALPQNDICSEWGDSYNGTPELGYKATDGINDAFREVVHLFIDPDGNDRTGFYTFESEEEEGEPAIKDLGCEMCAQFFMFFKPSTKLVSVAWEQTLVGPNKMGKHDGTGLPVGDPTGDYDYNGTFCQSWPDAADEAAIPVWGWQNPDNSGKGDNDCPRKENWKPAPAQNGIAKVEFSLEKKDMTNLKDEDEELACGIIFDWGGSYQATSALRISYSD
ncbi:MAG: hypothetical protein IK031_04625 [Bacteroidales bacterium]|nr:hypothetical protein [Bacteroidales bacterium]